MSGGTPSVQAEQSVIHQQVDAELKKFAERMEKGVNHKATHL